MSSRSKPRYARWQLHAELQVPRHDPGDHVPNRLTRAFHLALRGLGGADYCPTCRRAGSSPGPGSNIVEEGEELGSCPSCGHPVDYQGVAIGALVGGEVELPGLLVLAKGGRERLLHPTRDADGPSGEPGVLIG